MFYDFVGEGWAKPSTAYKIRPNITMSQKICEQLLGTLKDLTLKFYSWEHNYRIIKKFSTYVLGKMKIKIHM